MVSEVYCEDEITCPYCGDKMRDSWEVKINVNDGELGVLTCDECGKKFLASKNVTVTYNSYDCPCLIGEKEHEWKQIVGIPKEFFEGKFRCEVCGQEKKRND